MTGSTADDGDLARSTIYHLNRIGWSFTQIAEVVDVDPDTGCGMLPSEWAATALPPLPWLFA